MFFRIGVLKNFAIFTGKHFLIIKACNFVKKRLQHGCCFPVSIGKFLRLPFLTEHLWATASDDGNFKQVV